MAWWWMSFADPTRPRGSQFLSVLLIEADDAKKAMTRSHVLGLNPGGEVPFAEHPAVRARVPASSTRAPPERCGDKTGVLKSWQDQSTRSS
jgi:hypothetical protein